MSGAENKIMIPEEVILNKIYFIRNQKVMIDRDLAELYGVETKYLKRQVRRNIIRFPDDFMFELSNKEFIEWRSQFVTSNSDKIGLRYTPMAFTEEGVAQLSTVLNSERAIRVNIQIIRLFSKMRKLLSLNQEIMQKIDELSKKYIEHDSQIMLIFEYLKQFEEAKQKQLEQANRKRIGFKTEKE